MQGYLYRAIMQRSDMDGVGAWSLSRHFERLGWGIGDLLAAPDDVLLQAKGFGPKALERWRASVPDPMMPIAWNDPWRHHAEMVVGLP